MSMVEWSVLISIFGFLIYSSLKTASKIFIVIFSCLAVSLMMGAGLEASWFGYILALSYISGVMVLFLYLISLGPDNYPKSGGGPSSLILLVFLVCLSLSWASSGGVSGPEALSALQWEEGVSQLYSISNLQSYLFLFSLLLLILIIAVLLMKSSHSLRFFS